jgi:hypothetical protein
VSPTRFVLKPFEQDEECKRSLHGQLTVVHMIYILQDANLTNTSLVERMYFFLLALQSLGPWPLIFRFHDHFTDGRTFWTSDELVARCRLPSEEGNACLRPLGYRDRHTYNAMT